MLGGGGVCVFRGMHSQFWGGFFCWFFFLVNFHFPWSRFLRFFIKLSIFTRLFLLLLLLSLPLLFTNTHTHFIPTNINFSNVTPLPPTHLYQQILPPPPGCLDTLFHHWRRDILRRICPLYIRALSHVFHWCGNDHFRRF